MNTNLKGKICLVTGATAGIGRATALGLAELGATVIVAGRNEAKAAQVTADIRRQTGNDNVSPIIADFASLAQVSGLADEFTARFPRLDVLVNNAGLVTRTRRESEDGCELMFAVNYLAAFLLTNRLLDALKAAAPARIVNVSSFGYKKGIIQFDDLQFTQQFDHRRAYYQTRLAMVLFTLALARRLESSGVTVNVLHPGIVKTKLSHGYMGNPVFRFFEQMIAVSPQQGAQTSLYLASAPQVAGVTGHYFVKQQRKALTAAVQHQGLQERLWEISEELTVAFSMKTL